MGRKVHDLTGNRYGHLTAVEMKDERISGGVVWIVKCDCGTVKSIAASVLIRTRYCGRSCPWRKADRLATRPAKAPRSAPAKKKAPKPPVAPPKPKRKRESPTERILYDPLERAIENRDKRFTSWKTAKPKTADRYVFATSPNGYRFQYRESELKAHGINATPTRVAGPSR